MLFEKIKNISPKYLLKLTPVIIMLVILLVVIIVSLNMISGINQNTFSYTVKIQDAVEEVDKIFERAELNVNLMTDAISSSYDLHKQQDREYNLQYVKGLDGFIMAALASSPSASGAWFQLNADLPFAVYAYNWYEFKEDQFINVKDQFEGQSNSREINPEDDPYYYLAINNKRRIWSEIYTDADTKDKMMTISSPVYKMQSLVGVVGIDITVENLQKCLQGIQLSMGSSDLYLLDQKNHLIISQLFPDSKKPMDDDSLIKLFEENAEGPIEYLDNLTKKTAVRIELSNGYKLIIAFENKNLYKGINQIINIIYGLFFLLVIVISIVFKNKLKLTQLENDLKSCEKNLEETSEEQQEDS